MKRGKCTVDECSRPHKARGYCPTHYAQFFRGSAVVSTIRSRVREKPAECTEDGCSEPVKAKGLCKTHYQRLLRHGHVVNRARTKPFQVCSIPGCEGYAYSKKLCHAHYIKERKWKPYGIDATKYQEMLAGQKGVCAICGQPERNKDKATGRVKDLAVDHNHNTGAARALLCSNCNRALGLFGDDPTTLAKAASYLVSFG